MHSLYFCEKIVVEGLMARCPNCYLPATLKSQYGKGMLYRCDNKTDCNGVEFVAYDNEIIITTETLCVFLKAASPELCHELRH